MKRGFTLVELIVVVGIVAIIAAMALANFPSFRGRLALDREAGKLALALRKVQQYSGGVRRFDGPSPIPLPVACGVSYASQFPAYGVVVSKETPDNQKKYWIYADPDCDRESSSYAPYDMIEELLFDNNIIVDSICTEIDSPSSDCTHTKLDVWYVRPAPSVFFTIDHVADNPNFPQWHSAKVVLALQDGLKKSVIIRQTGQISIENE